MSVTDFECAIAKSQIARYIAGENLAPEISRHLEAHIAVCTRCKQLLQEKKNSLQAMIEDRSSTEERTNIEIPSQRIPMTKPTETPIMASTPEPETMAEEARQSLREKLREQARALSAKHDIENEPVEISAVAPAFAHRESTETVSVAKASDSKKRRLSLDSFALWRNVPVTDEKPAINKKNLQSAKAAVRNQSSFAKPMLYMAGLCAVVGGMSFFVKNPTSILGDHLQATKEVTKINGIKTAAKKPAKGTVKRLPAKGSGVINAEYFVDPKSPKKATAKTPTPKKPAAKVATAKKAMTKAPAVKKASTKKVAAHKLTPKTKSTTHKYATHQSKAPTHKQPKQNEVKLYAPDTK